MIEFGMPAMIELESIEESAALCAELGLSFLELNTNFPAQQPHLLDPDALNRIAEQYGIGYTIHLNDEMAVADFSPSVAAGYRQAVLETIAFAKKINAKKLNMHISEGAHYTMPDRIVYFYEAYQDEFLRGMAAFRDACEDAIGDSGITICMENSKAYYPFQKAALDVLLQSKVFCLTLDIGHNFCSGYVDEDWILARSNRLKHMHMHDAKERNKDHLPLGTGEMDIPRYINIALDCDCTVVLEVKTVAGLRASVEWLKKSRFI
jgi:sugar phosphate isomerase/epimerase